MSNETNRKPTHRLYVVTGEGDKANWTEIGAAWPHRDGEGFNITSKLTTVQFVMRTAKDRPVKQTAK